MNKYHIEVVETLSRMVEVEAINEDHARQIVEEQYNESEIVLDCNDNIDTQFDLIRDFNN